MNECTPYGVAQNAPDALPTLLARQVVRQFAPNPIRHRFPFHIGERRLPFRRHGTVFDSFSNTKPTIAFESFE